jgi:hypothetical protein
LYQQGVQGTPDAVEEEIGPFTGHLPAGYSAVVESTLSSMPERRVPSGNLWSYAPEAQPPSEQKRHYSGKLWAYGNNQQQKKGR